MLRQAMHVFSGFTLAFLWGVQAAGAVSFDRLDVASHMGEPFYAEVPLRLDENESISKTSVEIGSSSDYRILEVYRDQVVNNIRTDIISDERGPRVTLSSESAIDTAFFNMVLKVRYGRSTHYKNMPIFLESATAAVVEQNNQTPVIAAPVNAANVKPESSDAFVTKAPVDAKSAFEEPVEIVEVDDGFKAFGDWARTNRYGPMVYGDTITTVAQRLRLDDRFSNQRVMVALFEKNKAQFDKENINLIRVGTYLDVPTAEEMNQVSAQHAKQVVSEQNKIWKGMVKQPKYAAVADAQKKRYTRRVRVGQKASGVASAPMLSVDKTAMPKAAEVVTKQEKQTKNTNNSSSTKLSAAEEALKVKNQELTALQEKMAGMERRLVRAEEKAKTVQEANVAPVMTADSAAFDAQNKRLEIMVSRLKKQLEEARTLASASQSSGWMMYGLAGLALIVLGLIATVVLLLRREREHPAEQEDAMREEVQEQMPVDKVDVEEPAGDDDLSTKVMDVDDFEMPSEDPSGSAASVAEESTDGNVFGDEPLEEIPDFTDDETGKMEAFDVGSDDAPDPSVNYLEEADVYLRYGMEDEAENQVAMALKLQADDPAAHAKLVQIRRARGDDDGANESTSAAKALLSGAALVTFEGLLSSDAGAAPASAAIDEPEEELNDTSMSDLGDDAFTGDDTGIVDFGEINFDAPKDVMEPELLDTGEMDFGEVVEDETGANESINLEDSIDFSAIDFGEINLDDPKSSDEDGAADSDTVMDAEALDTGELDFGALGTDDTLEAIDEESSLDIDFSADDASSDADDVMLAESLDTGELDFGDLNLTDEATDNAEENDEQPLDIDLSGDLSSDSSLDTTSDDDDVMLSAETDTGELDFGDLVEPVEDAVLEEADTADEIDFDFSEMATDDAEQGISEDVVESEAVDTDEAADEVTFGTDDTDSGVDITDLGMDFDALDDESVPEDADKSLDLADLDVDFDNIDLDDVEPSSVLLTGEGDAEDISSFEEDTGSFESDSTAAVAVDDETMLVSTDLIDADPEKEVNDRDVDRALAEAEEDANAVSIELDTDADDPFLQANASLNTAEADNLSIDLDDSSLDSLMGEDVDALSLAEQADEESADDIALEEINLDEVDDATDDLLSDVDDGLSDSDMDDLESISIDLTGLDTLSSNGDELVDLGLDPEVESAVEENKAVDETLVSDLDIDQEDLSTIGDDLSDLDLDDIDLDSLLPDSSDNSESGIESVEKSSGMDDDFDSTVVLNKVTKGIQEVVPDLAEDLSEAEPADPMSDDYSATAELNQIEASMGNIGSSDSMSDTGEVSTELDALMNDLNGLLDEDEPKK
ncbi:MAG: FimV/HubP family polar landmark protein [Ghiorsea sp.]